MGEPLDTKSDELVAGKYRLLRMIGQGGMGSVWEGEHVSLGTKVAVKFIEHELAQSAEARDRFDKEARAAARLQSRYVVGVHDHGVMPDGRPFIVMEFLRGQTLEERAVACGRMDVVEVAHIISQVARGLSKAHELGIVHRDLKPENIFLTESPDDDETVAKIVDFGIAKFTEGTPLAMSSATRTGTILGTPVYMSPEQARGLRDIDHRSDLWALGVVVYRCVVGQLPFQGQAVGDIVVNICTKDAVAPTQVVPSLPAAFDAWFRRCVAREREDRFGSVKEQAASLLFVAGVVSHPDQAFPASSALSGPIGVVEGQTVPSQETLENAATQMGTASSVSTKRRSVGVIGAAIALLGALAVVVGLVGWIWYSATPTADVVGASPPVASEARDVEPRVEVVPVGAPEASSPAPMGSDMVEVDAGVSSDPGKGRRSGRASPVGARSSQPPQTPPASTATVDLGY
jgi:serine/threonine protein kinase